MTLEQLKSTAHHLDSDAPAAYLINSVTTRFEISPNGAGFLRTNHHYRIKIYNDKGEGYGEFDIKAYIGDRESEKVSGIKAFTYNEIGGQIEKTKLEKDDIFKEKSNSRWTATKFAMPKVKSGSIIDVKYSTTSPFFWNMDRYYFCLLYTSDAADE